jgi:hypothetical protein
MLAAEVIADGECPLTAEGESGRLSPRRVRRRSDRALTTAELERWWGSDELCRSREFSADLRVNGPWSITVRWAVRDIVLAAGEFIELVAMWVAMMAVMMLPGAAPAVLRRAREATGSGFTFGLHCRLAASVVAGPEGCQPRRVTAR